MSKEPKTKSTNWLKGILSQSDSPHSNESEALAATQSAQAAKHDTKADSVQQETSKSVFSKDTKDKAALQLIVATEQILNERQLLQYKNNDLQSELKSAHESIARLKQDLAAKEQTLQDKLSEIGDLEQRLTHRQMSYEQLLEDYKSYQASQTEEYEKLSSELDKERHKYMKLNDESTEKQMESMRIIKSLEEKIRSLEVENQKQTEAYQAVLNEKNQLVQTFNDFTQRMSSSVSNKAHSPNHQSK